MKNILYLFLAITSLMTIQACSEEGVSKFMDDESISGYLITTDTSNNIIHQSILKNVEVFLTDKNAIGKYLYKVTTDHKGFFTFSHVPINKTDLYIYSDTIIDAVHYSGIKKTTLVKDTLFLYPKQDSSIKYSVIITVIDTTNGVRITLSDIRYCLFNNPLFAERDTTNKDCSGSIKSDGKTNIYGYDTLRDLSPGIYYITIHDSIAGYQFNAWHSYNFIPKNQISRDTVKVKRN